MAQCNLRRAVPRDLRPDPWDRNGLWRWRWWISFTTIRYMFASDPFLDSSGLLFGAGNTLINIWGNATPGSYTMYGLPPAYAPTVTGLATLTAVPEPTTIISGALMLLPFGASTLRILRKRVA